VTQVLDHVLVLLVAHALAPVYLSAKNDYYGPSSRVPWMHCTDDGCLLETESNPEPGSRKARRAPPSAVLNGGAGWALLEVVAMYGVQYDLRLLQQLYQDGHHKNGVWWVENQALKVVVYVFVRRAADAGCMLSVAAQVVRPRKRQQARRSRRAQLRCDPRPRTRPGKRLRSCAHLQVP
jgi:hypothetical protein